LYLHNISASVAAVLCNAAYVYARIPVTCQSCVRVPRARACSSRPWRFFSLSAYRSNNKKNNNKKIKRKKIPFIPFIFSVKNDIVMGLCQRRSALRSGKCIYTHWRHTYIIVTRILYIACTRMQVLLFVYTYMGFMDDGLVACLFISF